MFTQNVFHPPTLYALGDQSKPTPLADRANENNHLHIEGCYRSVLSGANPPADVTIGATAALTAILGHEAMTKQKVVQWSDLNVAV